MRDKESKSLKLLKKGMKKNEIVIYAIAIMLVTAGYFNYTANVDNDYLEASSQEINENNTSVQISNINENNTQAETSKKAEENEDKKKSNVENNTVNVANIAEKQENKDDEDIGDAKLVNSDVSADYFATSKLERDTNYADMISTYTSIIEDNSISETQKSTAMKEITKINDNKNSISICENLLSTKGFKNCIVFVNNDSINVVVAIEGGLTKEKVAQIQNIISREFKIKIENIHITEKK